jgi:hypothetical protein
MAKGGEYAKLVELQSLNAKEGEKKVEKQEEVETGLEDVPIDDEAIQIKGFEPFHLSFFSFFFFLLF